MNSAYSVLIAISIIVITAISWKKAIGPSSKVIYVLFIFLATAGVLLKEIGISVSIMENQWLYSMVKSIMIFTKG